MRPNYTGLSFVGRSSLAYIGRGSDSFKNTCRDPTRHSPCGRFRLASTLLHPSPSRVPLYRAEVLAHSTALRLARAAVALLFFSRRQFTKRAYSEHACSHIATPVLISFACKLSNRRQGCRHKAVDLLTRWDGRLRLNGGCSSLSSGRLRGVSIVTSRHTHASSTGNDLFPDCP